MSIHFIELSAHVLRVHLARDVEDERRCQALITLEAGTRPPHREWLRWCAAIVRRLNAEGNVVTEWRCG